MKKKLLIVLLVVSNGTFAKLIKPFIEYTNSFYAPYLGMKNDINIGIHSTKKNENYLSFGIGLNDQWAFNLKETIVLDKKFLNLFQPAFSVQFKYNNQRPINISADGPITFYYFTKHSLISSVGFQLPIKKNKFVLQLLSGLSYNLGEITRENNYGLQKRYSDNNFNSVTSFSIIKIF